MRAPLVVLSLSLLFWPDGCIPMGHAQSLAGTVQLKSPAEIHAVFLLQREVLRWIVHKSLVIHFNRNSWLVILWYVCYIQSWLRCWMCFNFPIFDLFLRWQPLMLTKQICQATLDLWEGLGRDGLLLMHPFRPAVEGNGTFLASFGKRFAPTGIGISEVWLSHVVQEKASGSFLAPDLPVAPISLKQVRRELLDEDVSCGAPFIFCDIILQDPLAIQLGTSLRGWLQHGDLHDEVDQYFKGTFQIRASSTWQKSAASLQKLAKHLQGLGQLHLLRVSEPQLYAALCNRRASGAGVTAAQHVTGSRHFLGATAKFTAIDTDGMISARFWGFTRDMYCTKSPLGQKKLPTVELVCKLENAMVTVGSFLRCIVEQLLFCIYSCCRWKDAQRLKPIEVETGRGEALLYGNALDSKTTVSAEARTLFLPYAAIGTSASGVGWSQLWVDARLQEGTTLLTWHTDECIRSNCLVESFS